MRRAKYHSSISQTDFDTLNVINNLLEERELKPTRSNLLPDNNENSVSAGDPLGNNEQTREEEDVNYWPNCDTSIMLRSCEEEVIEPLHGKITGTVPKWLKGTLLRNGPGSLKVGEYTYNHIFDSAALLHRFEISENDVTYQRRFVETEVYKRNKAAQRIVVTAFGTKVVPDPCQSIFNRVATVFNSADNHNDNSMISVYTFGDEYYTFTEVPTIHRIDPKTLETIGKVDVSEYVGIVNHTSHPHVMTDGTVYNLGQSITACGPTYNVVCFAPSRVTVDENGEEKELSMFDQATIVATVPSRWVLNPSYMHTFGITENYFIIVEQPLALSLITAISCQVTKEPMGAALKWHENENTLIHVVSRETGTLVRTFVAEAFFYLHIINQFETRDRDYVVLDICCYRDAKMLDCMFVEKLKNIHKNPDYARLFRGRPLRFILPMKQPASDVPLEHNLITIRTVNQSFEVFRGIEQECSGMGESCSHLDMINDSNISGDHTSDKFDETGDQKGKSVLKRKAAAHRLPDGGIFVKPELLCDLGCETPRLNYDSYLGREYRYFYAISSDVDLENPGTLIKVDTVRKTRKTWCEKNVYPSEPIFVPNPNGKSEDDGVVVSALVWGQERETEVGLLILDAATFTEIARATFDTPGPVPKCLHGWFTLNK